MVTYLNWRTLLRLQSQHGPDKTWQKGPWGCRLMEDTIELVFKSVHGDWKNKHIMNNFLKVSCDYFNLLLCKKQGTKSLKRLTWKIMYS